MIFTRRNINTLVILLIGSSPGRSIEAIDKISPIISLEYKGVFEVHNLVGGVLSWPLHEKTTVPSIEWDSLTIKYLSFLTPRPVCWNRNGAWPVWEHNFYSYLVELSSNITFTYFEVCSVISPLCSIGRKTVWVYNNIAAVFLISIW
jgi:hypothetical protein